MATIDHLTGVAIGSSITVPLVIQASDAPPNVIVPSSLKRLLDKAGLSPPDAGQKLTIAHVNDKLSTAKMPNDERLEVKAALIRMGMVQIGKGVRHRTGRIARLAE